MWPSTSWKNIPPYLSLLVSLSFSTNNVCKNAVFFLAVSFPKKAFVLPNNRQTIESAKCTFAASAGWRNFLENEKQNSRKIRPKSSLKCFLHAALQILWIHFFQVEFYSWRAACKKRISDFLGRIVFPHPNELNFGMWPSTSWKNIPPYLSLLVSLSFSTNNVCKNAVFFPGGVLSKESFCFTKQ